ncbi:MAG TPA: exodeoxyribonuclease VII large subunit [Lachnospiraceae bacterium]|nr:exodeoxyribonuclease VII large subunit [Lachnospiraceae bacterium]
MSDLRAKNIYSVVQVNSYIKNMFAQDYLLGLVSVRGEVSNLKYHSSGHIYFTLKDEKAAIACVMFASNRSGLKFRMQEGQQVVAAGSVEVYERDGKYQLYVKTVEQDGQGNLSEQFEALKQRLEEMGMFASEYKQAIPSCIKTLGVVTARTGAAIQDIINISLRRNPYLQIILYPALVQGEQAKESIVRGIQALEQYGVDTIIVGRGGGSMEDLWAFNEECVAQAIFDCKTPIISAVGHETDITIADFVADLRAPTPSAAAELAVYELNILTQQMTEYKEAFDYRLQHVLEKKKNLLDRERLKLKHLSPASVLNEKRRYLIAIEEQLNELMNQQLREKKHRFNIYLEQMKGRSPLDKLNQGYSFVSDNANKAVTTVDQVNCNDRVSIHLVDGVLQTTVTEIIRRDQEQIERWSQS